MRQADDRRSRRRAGGGSVQWPSIAGSGDELADEPGGGHGARSHEGSAAVGTLRRPLVGTKRIYPMTECADTPEGPATRMFHASPVARRVHRARRSHRPPGPGPTCPASRVRRPCYAPALTAVTERSSAGRGRSERGMVRAARKTPARTSLASRAAGAR